MDTRSAAPILGDTAASRAARLNTRRARRLCAAAARPFIAFPGDFIEVSPPVIYFVVNRSKKLLGGFLSAVYTNRDLHPSYALPASARVGYWCRHCSTRGTSSRWPT